MARLLFLFCMMTLFRVCLLLSVVALPLPRAGAEEPFINSAAPTFGFSGPEIFPIDTQISQLHAADLDGDGLNDLIVVNNARSRITVLYNQTGKTNSSAPLKPTGRVDVNELPPDARFRIDSIASEKRIDSSSEPPSVWTRT